MPLPPRSIQAWEMRFITVFGLIGFAIISAIAWAIFGLIWVLAYYTIGGVIGLFETCYWHREEFLFRGKFHRSRALKACIVVTFLWPFLILHALGI
jgi:hypothetical protein